MVVRNLSHYEVLEELGRGGMGVVYKARDTSLKRLVALKLLPPDLAGDPRRVALLRREAQASAKLNHPRIVTIYSVEEAEGQLFLTMEFVAGRTLDKAIPSGGFDLGRFFRIAIPLADALATAHEQEIVHRDLKPGNIILSKEGRPKILDFGLARLRPDESVEIVVGGSKPLDSQAITQMETLEGRLAGTVPYMSPEQLSCQPVDHRTDIFSLGVVFYEMATGRHPYRSGDSAISSAILQDEPDSVADVRTELPRQLGRIIRRCLEKNPDERIQSAKDLRNELEDLSRETSTSARRIAQSPGRGRRLILPALLTATILAGASWLLYGRLVGDPPIAPAPYHLSVEEDRIFPGDRGPDYYRGGVLDTLAWQLSALSGIYFVAGDEPDPDITIQADVRRSGETIGLSFRVLDSQRDVELGSEALEGGAEDPFDLVERAAQSIAGIVGRGLDVAVGYRPGRRPTADTAAFDLYLQAAATAGEGAQQQNAAAVHELLQQALSHDPDFARAHLLEGQTYLEQHRAKQGEPGLAAQAAKHCGTAAELDPALGAAHTCLGETLGLQDQTLDAVAAYRRALELDTSDLTPHYGLRDAYLDLGLPESAERDWLALIREHPNFWAGYYSLGTYYQDLERYEEALEQYLRALELAPRNAEVHSYLGTLYFYLGRFEEATVALQDSIEIRPTWDAYYNLGGIYYSLRRFDAAVAAFEQAVQLSDSDYEPHGRLGWSCHWAPGRRDEAPAHLQRAIELAQSRLEVQPEDSDALILMALFQAIIGDREPSLESLQRAFDLRPNDPHYFFLAALAANHLGDTDRAVDWLQRAVRGGYSTAEIRTIVDFDNLHSDPRFQQLLREAATNHPSS